jgi:hypothetical protein
VSELTIEGINGSILGTPLAQILLSDNIEIGSKASYELCKLIYSYHPYGAKLVDTPVQLAQSQGRVVNVPGIAEERVVRAFLDEWKAVKADRVIANCVRLARIYGISSMALMVLDEDPTIPVDFASLAHKKISFNCFDPLNTAGSLVLDLNPNSIAYLKPVTIRVQGQTYHISRSVIFMNEDPIYLDYTSSAYGFVGRSVYQRALFPLKSFLQSIITDDLVTRKAGLLIAKLKQPGSVINNVMQNIAGIKRQLLKVAVVGNVMNIGTEEEIESLNLQNVDASHRTARKNILENIAAAAGMPAKLVNSETLAVAFAEGQEDAKAIARFIDDLRESMAPLYDFMNKIVQFRAWNIDFFETIKNDFPKEYGKKTFNEAFMEWTNRFVVLWPSLLTEPESEKIKVANVKLRSIISMLTTLLDMSDDDNKAKLLEWAQQNFNDLTTLFPTPLKLDTEKMAKFKPPIEEGGDGFDKNKGKKTFGGSAAMMGKSDSTEQLNEAVIDLFNEIEARKTRNSQMRLTSE